MIPLFRSFQSTVTPFDRGKSAFNFKVFQDPVTGAPTGLQAESGTGPDGIWTPIDVTAEQIGAPDALMLADLNATYRLNQAPYTRYVSNGTSLVTAMAGSSDVSGSMVTAIGSTTQRSLSFRAADVVNVKDFGAVGDGTTDDTAAQVAAIGTGNRTVYYPKGRYKVAGSAAIVVPSNTTFLGDGPAQSIIVPANGFGGFQNTLLHTLTAFTTIPTTPSAQTDSGFVFLNLGVDCTTFTGSLFQFLFAKNILFQNIWTDNYQSSSAPTYTAIQLMGCDNVTVDNTIMRNVASSVNGWKGTTNVKVSNHHVVAGLAADSGVVALNGQGTIASDQEFSSNFEITNSTIELASNAVALLFDSLEGGSSVTDVKISNVNIKATAGMTNFGLVARGRGSRVKVHNLTIEAEPGAAFSNPVLVGGAYENFAPYVASGIITTSNGTDTITISMPSGTSVGPGNYMLIHAGAGGNLVGNGLTLNGFYLVLSVSGPADEFQSGTSVTVKAPMNATSSGAIALSSYVVGFIGAFTDCEFNGITFDGVGAVGTDLIMLNGGGHVLSNIVQTQNYGASSTPPYRSVIALDQTVALHGAPPLTSISIANLQAAPGTASLAGGWIGDHLVSMAAGGPYPTIMATVGGGVTAGNAAALPLVGGALSGGISFGAADAASATDLTRHIELYDGGYAGFNIFSSSLNYISGGAHTFYANGSNIGYINSTGLNSMSIGQQTPTIGTFSAVQVQSTSGPTWSSGPGVPVATLPVGSLYSRTGGGVGSTLYVSRGAGVWNAVAGV